MRKRQSPAMSHTCWCNGIPFIRVADDGQDEGMGRALTNEVSPAQGI
ncbi:hypothetical protein [Laceyella sediminis]|nr:hypothetical protein [Laceyella sediminis]